MNALIALWIAVALVSMCMAPLVFDEFDIFDNLGIEGRAVLAIACAAVWPLFLVFGVLWVGRAFFIGLGQVWRMLVPAKAKLPKAKLPKAQVRR